MAEDRCPSVAQSRNKEFVAFMAKMSYNKPPVMNTPGELRYENEMSPVAPHIELGVSCATRISRQPQLYRQLQVIGDVPGLLRVLYWRFHV